MCSGKIASVRGTPESPLKYDPPFHCVALALAMGIGAGEDVSASSEMCSWKRGERGLLCGTGVLSSMEIGSEDE